MILTVTPNTALDKVIFVEDFAFGKTVRARDVAEGMGGKGAVVSWVLGQLGTPSIATGLVAGETGRRMEAMLRQVGVQTEFVWAEGETRTNYVFARIADGAQGTVTVASLRITEEHITQLTERVLCLLDRADLLLCGGTLPQGMPVDWYVPLIKQAKQRGILTLLDASEPFLSANIVALPDMVKPNEAEASALLGYPVHSVAQASQAVHELQARGIAVPIITLGGQGAVAATDEGVMFVPPLTVRVANTAGAGDGFNAGLIQARLRGASWPEALRWAGAVATAVLLTPGTGVCHLEDAQRLLSDVQVRRIA